MLFEHVLLYSLKERIPDREYVLSLEEAEMVRAGEHFYHPHTLSDTLPCDAGCQDLGEQRVRS